MRGSNLVLLLGALGACTMAPEAADPVCDEQKCDDLRSLDDSEVPASPCDGILIDRSGRTNSDGSPIQRVAGRLGDRLAKTVYAKAGACPVDMKGILAALDADGGASCGSGTFVVSEDAQISGQVGGLYRAVTSYQCSRNAFELLFSSFGVEPTGSDIPDGVEIMAFDETDGVFNYYKEVGGKMAFFGDSIDFVGKGPGGPGVTSVRGCANCHTGGGPIMKELSSPWTHWARGTFETPGAQELVDNRQEQFGFLSQAEDLERGIVVKGNKAWLPQRIDFLLAHGTARDLLRPVFCPVEINLSSGDRAGIRSELLVSRELTRFGRIPVDEQGFDAIVAAIGQGVPGHSAATTASDFLFVDRSEADSQYIAELVERQIIDRAFVEAVHLVDMTRPVFSDDRCDLLEFAPIDLSADELSPSALRQGFLANLDASPPAAMLRQLFQRSEDGEDLGGKAAAERFLAACKARQSSDTVDVGGNAVSALHVDAFKLRSLARKLAYGQDGVLDDAAGSAERPMSVFEFPQTMPVDEIEVTESADPRAPTQVHPAARLSPVDCTLVSSFQSLD